MELTCLYHPYLEMVVTDDEKRFKELLDSGLWFRHPNEAKQMRSEYENERLHDEKGKRSRNRVKKT